MTAPSSSNGAKPRRPRTTGTKAKVTVEAVNLPTALNLDELEREGRPEPFGFIHNDRQYILEDPQDQDWQQLIVVLNNPVMFLRLVLRDADKEAFFNNPMPAWKLNVLTKAYREHYGLPGESGESDGLSLS